MGRQKQRLNVIFDSGSTNLWLASWLCHTNQCTNNKETLYDIRKSGKEAKQLCGGGSSCISLLDQFQASSRKMRYG